MAEYKYSAKDESGKLVKGTMEAADEDALYVALREKGLFLLEGQSTEKAGKTSVRLKKQALADYCRQLGTLIGSGISLVRALSIMANEEGLKPQYAKVYNNLSDLIRQGIPLSDAMEQQGRAFPELLVSMMRSAETNGNIDKTALRMANHYEKEHRMNGKVRNAMVYPIILLCLLVVVVVFLLTFMLPQFEDMFAEMDTLPLPTRILMGMSDGVKNHWMILIIIIVAIVVGIKILFQLPGVRLVKDKVKLHIPVVGKLLTKIYTARFARTLSSLYSSGLPIVRAVQIAGDTVGNSYIQRQLVDVVATIRSGEPLSRGLSTVHGFQKKLASTIMVGEETGALDSMLDSIADSLEFEAERAMERLVALLEPALIIVMALVVGFVMIAIILPVYQSYSTIEQA